MPQLSKQHLQLTEISTILHFLVDGLCICCLYLTTSDVGEVLTIYILYNVLAFLTQPLTGWWADRMCQPHWMLLTSVVLLTLAVLTASVTGHQPPQETGHLWPYLTATLLGMGNSLFHVWGGRQTAVHTGNDIRAIGVFVSTGAFGLAIGAVFASWFTLYVFLLSICALAVLTQTLPSPSLRGESRIPPNEETNEQSNHSLSSGRVRGGAAFLLLLILLIVAGRSFAGEAFTTGITKSAVLLIVLGATAMLGKMAGGWLVRGLGMWKAVLLMVVGATLCFFGKNLHIAVMFAGLFLVNCTMPVTLYYANVLLKGHEGLAFGLLAAALIPGYLIAQPIHVFDMPFGLDTSYILRHTLTALIPTILIELGVLWLLLERRRKVLISSIFVNVLTNVPLNLYVLLANGSMTHILIGEVLVFFIESVWYWFFTRNLRQAVLYSFLCNTISFLIGILVWSLLTLCNT